METGDYVRAAKAAVAVATGTGVPVLVNDRADVALAAGAAGVHLGQGDLDVNTARAILGADASVGVSVKTPEQAGVGPERLPPYLRPIRVLRGVHV